MGGAERGCAFVTGGASGIGLEMARRFAGRGWDVAMFDLEPGESALARVHDACRGHGQRVRAYGVDVGDGNALCHVFVQAAEEIGRPGLVLNSAGIVCARPFLQQSPEEFERVIRVNLLGSRNAAAAALPLLTQGGHLALVASLAGLIGTYGYSSYAASKFGVVGLAEVLRMELAPQGIDISVICPPEVETPMVVHERTYRPAATTALKRLGGNLSVERACDEILRDLDRRKFMIIPGRRARIVWRLLEWTPRSLNYRVADGIVARTGGAA